MLPSSRYSTILGKGYGEVEHGGAWLGVNDWLCVRMMLGLYMGLSIKLCYAYRSKPAIAVQYA
jgi:hypothetical protein